MDTKIDRELAGIKIGDAHPVRIMGVLNLGPESFFKGSVVNTVELAVERAILMVQEGAEILDIGAVSTAPGVKEISEVQEHERLMPILEAVLDAVKVPISIDTFRAGIAEEALKNGAKIINDVSGYKMDNSMVKILCEHDAPSVIMATKNIIGDPLTVPEIYGALQSSIKIAEIHGYDSTKIIIDPAIGRWVSDKTYQYNFDIINNLNKFSKLNMPILVGISRKSFIHEVLNRPDPLDRLMGSLSSTAISVYNGAHIVRTHDVAQTVDVVKMAELLRQCAKESDIN